MSAIGPPHAPASDGAQSPPHRRQRVVWHGERRHVAVFDEDHGGASTSPSPREESGEPVHQLVTLGHEHPAS